MSFFKKKKNLFCCRLIIVLKKGDRDHGLCLFHLRNMLFVSQDLEQLAAEVRAEIVYTVAKTGGHLSSSLGVVELTVAMHHVFDCPQDKIIWDVGHQVNI